MKKILLLTSVILCGYVSQAQWLVVSNAPTAGISGNYSTVEIVDDDSQNVVASFSFPPINFTYNFTNLPTAIDGFYAFRLFFPTEGGGGSDTMGLFPANSSSAFLFDDSGTSTIIDLGPNYDPSPTPVPEPSVQTFFAAGFAFGLTCFGFGWIKRMATRTVADF